VSWDAVTAIATSVQAVVILLTVVFGVVQLSDGRRESRFNATRSLINSTLDPSFYSALQFVLNDLDSRLLDPEYADELRRSLGWAIDDQKHPEILVLARLEEIGLYQNYQFVSTDAVVNFLGELIVGVWEKLVPVVEIMRASHTNPHVWSNAESLYRVTRAYLERHGRGIGVRQGTPS
jgi:hypothetical protein